MNMVLIMRVFNITSREGNQRDFLGDKLWEICAWMHSSPLHSRCADASVGELLWKKTKLRWQEQKVVAFAHFVCAVRSLLLVAGSIGRPRVSDHGRPTTRPRARSAGLVHVPPFVITADCSARSTAETMSAAGRTNNLHSETLLLDYGVDVETREIFVGRRKKGGRGTLEFSFRLCTSSPKGIVRCWSIKAPPDGEIHWLPPCCTTRTGEYLLDW